MTFAELLRRNCEITTIALDCEVRQFWRWSASGVIYPGMWVAPAGDEGGGAIVPSPIPPSYPFPLLIAMEQGEVGKTVHDAYDDGDFVNVLIPKKGDIIAVRVADDTVIDTQDLSLLVNNGDGTFRLLESGEDPFWAPVLAIDSCDTTEEGAIPLVRAFVL